MTQQHLLSLLGLLALGPSCSSPSAGRTAPLRHLPPTEEVTLETVAELPIRPSAAVRLRDGRVVWTEHFGAPNPNHVHVLTSKRDFGDLFPAGVDLKAHSLRVDDDGILYGIDMGSETQPAVLWAWDPAAERLVTRIEIGPPAKEPQSSFGDFVVDLRNRQVLIGDTAGGTVPFRHDPAVVVVDLDTGSARRLLVGHESVQAEALDTFVNGRQMWLTTDRTTGARIPSRWGVNGIGLDPQGDWVYFGPMSSRDLYRVSAELLADFAVPEPRIASAVERYGDKPINDGLWVDESGRVFTGDVEHHAVGATGADGRWRPLVHDHNLLQFPDHFAMSRDGWLYVAAVQSQRGPFFNDGDLDRPPYRILRFRPPAPKEERLGRPARRP